LQPMLAEARNPLASELFPHLFEPIQLGPLHVPNRIVMTTHGGGDLAYFAERARGGTGLLFASGAAVGVSHYTPAPGKFQPYADDSFDALLPNPATPECIAYFDARVVP